MSKLSIRTKLVSVIVFMLVVISGLGLLAIRSMQTSNAHTVDIATNWLPSVRMLGELRADINLFRVALRAHLLAQGRAREIILRLDDLADGFLLGNSLRGLLRARRIQQ